MAAGLDVLDEGTHAVDRIRRHQTLLREDIFQLRVVFVGEGGVVSFFDGHAAFLRFANAAAAGALHAVEYLVLGAGQVGAIGAVMLGGEAEAFRVFEGEVRIGDFEMENL